MKLTAEQRLVLFAVTRHALRMLAQGLGPVEPTYARYVADCWLKERRQMRKGKP